MMRKLILLVACAFVTLAWAVTDNGQKSAVVRSMGYGKLTPLPAAPQQQWTRVLKQPAFQRKSVRKVAADYKMPAQLYGLLVYSRKWPNGSGTGNYGVYSFTADKPNTMKAVAKDDIFAASGGAIYGPEGRFNVLNYTSLWGTIILDFDYYEYSTQYWDMLQHVHKDDITRLMSSTGVYDPTTKTYYAVMYTEDMSHQVFGTLDYASNTRNVICQVPDAQSICAMAISPEGTIYAIRFDGKLVQLNKSNGHSTVIGSTGVTPKYLQSAAIDPRTGRMFWAACSEEDPVGLYEVNLETGEALLIQQFNNSEEFVGLYIPAPPAAEDAPAAPGTLVAKFTNDELEGSVSFRLPAKTYAGEAITDATLGYRVYVDDVLTAEGEGEPNATVQPSLSVAESKMYRLEASAVNAAGEGPRVHLDKFIGKDQPTAPTNIRLAKTSNENELKLTWNAPSTNGVHKGYVSRDNLNYTIVRMPDSVLVAEKYTERVLTETFVPSQLANYYYVVRAYNGDIEGLSGESNRQTLGTVVEPPYFENFEDLTVVPSLYTFIDANKDGNTWRSGFWNGTQNSDVYYQYNEDQKTPADDWMLTPPIHLSQGRFYTLSFDANGYFLGTEKFSVWMGAGKTVADMTTQLLGTQVVDYSDQHHFSCLVKSDVDGTRHFGFHAESDADQGILEIDNIRIEENGVFEAPDTVTNFIVTPGERGARNAVLTFCAPTTDFYGQPISQIDKIEIYRGDALRQTFENPEPGSELTYKDTSLPNSEVTWSVYTYNSHGCGIPAQQTAWIGTDIPDEPIDLTLTMNGTTAVLTWKAPTTGVHGGYINSQSLTYNIEDMNFIIKATKRAGTRYTENRGATQDFLSYRVSAQSAAGGGNYAYSNTVISGTPYKLPFFESFAGASTNHLWSQQTTGGQIGLTNSIAADGDQGAALYKPDGIGQVGMLTTGKISVNGAAHPVLEFYYLAIPGQTNTLTVAAVPEGDSDKLEALHVIDYTKLSGNNGWRKVTVSLDNYTGCNHILLSFIAQVTGSKFGDIAIDAITVREQDDVDMAIDSFTMPSMVEAGKPAQAVATVYNNGRLDATDYKVRLTKNGDVIEEQNGTQLASGKKTNFTFSVPTSVAEQSPCAIAVSVVAAGDANNDNDQASASLTLEAPLYPVPESPAATEQGGYTVITWASPDLSPRDVKVNDDFELYQPFIIDGIGRWTVRDADGLPTQAIIANDQTVLYDHVGEPMAFQVFCPEAVGLGSVAALKPHSGSQMLMNILEASTTKADDWLISPELNGREQTITFWVKSMDASLIETFAVLASQTDTRATSFKAVEATATQAPAEWTLVSAQLPQGTRYFAVRVNARQKFMLMIDDFEYALFNTADLKLLGYNVYLDDLQLNNELITGHSFRTTSIGEADYRISAVYEQGESAPSMPAGFVEGIVSVREEGMAVKREVYDLQGRRINQSLPVRRGVYIQKGRKVVVK